MPGLREFGFLRGGSHQQFGATLLVVAAARAGAIDFKRELADAIAIFAQFSFY